MKTITKKIVVSLVVMACMSFLLLGCSKKGSKDSQFIGTWTLESMGAEGQVLNLTELAEAQNVEVSTLESKLTVNKDGTVNMSNSEVSSDGTWEEKDGKVTMTMDGETMEVTFADEKATLVSQGVTLVFKK